MATLVFHEHPRQGGHCLTGAFADYVKRIPVNRAGDLDALWQDIRSRPFEADLGGLWDSDVVASCPAPAARAGTPDTRCTPAQRSRVWPATMNCWEATAHFVAGALVHLGHRYAVHVWDRDLPNGARHMWPSLIAPRGDHLLVQLDSVVPRSYPKGLHTGVRECTKRSEITARKGFKKAGGVLMDMSLLLLSSRGRIDRAALSQIVKNSNERRRRLFTKVAELGFSLIMFFFGGLEIKIKDASGNELDPTSEKVRPEDKLNAILEGLKTTTKGTLFREFMRPFLISAAEVLATMMEPDEMMLNIMAGADPLTGAPQLQQPPVYQPPQLPPGGPQVYVPAPVPQQPVNPIAAQYEGRLIRGDGDPKVYHVAGGKKHWIVTEQVLKQRGYNWAMVSVIPLSVVMQIPDGPPET